MIYSRGNKRNSWSNYQPDKNALNFKKAFRQEAPATDSDSWVSGIVDSSRFPDCQTVTHLISTGSLKILSPLQTWSWGTLRLLELFWEEARGKETHTHTHTPKALTTLILWSNSHVTLQQNAVNINSIDTNKRIVSCFIRNNSQNITAAKVTTFVRGKSKFWHSNV